MLIVTADVTSLCCAEQRYKKRKDTIKQKMEKLEEKHEEERERQKALFENCVSSSVRHPLAGAALPSPRDGVLCHAHLLDCAAAAAAAEQEAEALRGAFKNQIKSIQKREARAKAGVRPPLSSRSVFRGPTGSRSPSRMACACLPTDGPDGNQVGLARLGLQAEYEGLMNRRVHYHHCIVLEHLLARYYEIVIQRVESIAAYRSGVPVPGTWRLSATTCCLMTSPR